jgi:2-oxo-4-hydroxy-4-carboxy--5-ureidoimidazoline (OHCU) decarboxylase
MSKIRMNTEYRNKFYNRIKDVFEKEETQEQQAFFQSREDFNEKQKSAFEVARQIVERSYPKEDVATLRVLRKSMATHVM